MAKRLVTTGDTLDGQVSLGIECLDRIYLNGYVLNLQVGGDIGRRGEHAHSFGGVLSTATAPARPVEGPSTS